MVRTQFRWTDSKDFQAIFTHVNDGTDQMAWLTAEVFAKLANISCVDAQSYLDEHGTPLEKEGWYEVSTRPI